MKLSDSLAGASLETIGLLGPSMIYVGFSNGDSVTLTADSIKTLAITSSVEYLAETDLDVEKTPVQLLPDTASSPSADAVIVAHPA